MHNSPNESGWSVNGSNQPYDHHNLDPPGDTAVYLVIIVSNILAILINSFVIIVTVSMATLRRCISSYLVLQLCVFDIMASCASLPKFIRLLSSEAVLEDTTFCVVYEFLNGFFTYSLCACILAINVDKYHSIKFPMHYSSHVTKTTVLITQGIILLISIGFASTPLYTTNGSHVKSCWHVFSHGLVSLPFGFVTVIVFFILPVVLMTIMNVSVYRVAKRSLAQISAAPTITYDAFYKRSNTSIKNNNGLHKDCRQESAISVIAISEKNGLSGSPFCANLSPDDKMNHSITSLFQTHSTRQLPGVDAVQRGDALTLDCSNLANWKTCAPNTSNNIRDKPCSDRQHSPLNGSLVSQKDLTVMKAVPKISKSNTFKKNTFVLKTNYKAVRSLVVPYVYFILIWGSYFLLYLNYLHNDGSTKFSSFFSAVGCIIYVSFALNPVIYVLMRKNFKEESVEFFRSCRRKPKMSVLEFGVSQTFQQFLDSSS